ncbi:MAG: type IV pilin protein [Limnohabitans sp.]
MRTARRHGHGRHRGGHGHGKDDRGHGFTLVELLVTLVLLGLLAALIWPSYSQHLRRMRRLDAQTSLEALHLAQTRWRSQRGEFSDSLQALGWASDRSRDGHYRLQILSADTEGFTLQATPMGPQAQDLDCSPMQLQLVQRATLVRSAGLTGQGDRACWR